MLIDNENKNPKVYEWINKFTEEGELDVIVDCNSATERLKENLKYDEKFQLKNFDLITWFVVS